MLEVLGVALAIVSSGGLAGVIALALALNSARKEQLADAKAASDYIAKQRDENERTADDRDAALARATKAEAENTTLHAQLAATQALDATKAEKEAQHVSDEVRNAPDASDALDRELQESARVPGDDAPTAGAGDGDAGKPAV